MQPDLRDVGYLFDMLQHARGVERRIEIIGEAAKRIAPVFREAHPEIPWAKIIAQRNMLAHE